MKIQIEISNKDLLDFGRKAIEQEVQVVLNRLKSRDSATRTADESRKAVNKKSDWKFAWIEEDSERSIDKK